MWWKSGPAAIIAFALLVAAATAVAQQTPLRVDQAPPPQQSPPPAQAQPATPPPPQPFRTEILNFDNWTVTCQEFADGKRKRICAATLQIIQQNTSQAIFVWTIAYDDDNRPIATFQTPSGVAIAPGLEFKTPKSTRTIPFLTCDPGRCTARIVMDAALAQDLAGAASIDASIRASGGNTVRFDIPMKGYDKAVAALK